MASTSGELPTFDDAAFADFLASGVSTEHLDEAPVVAPLLDDAPVTAKPKGFQFLEQIDRALAAKRAGPGHPAGQHGPPATRKDGPHSSHATAATVPSHRTSIPASGASSSHTVSRHPYVPPHGGHGGGGSGVKVSEPPLSSVTPTIGGKPLFSSLRENAALADMIEEVEQTVLTSARPVTWDDVVGLEAAKRSLEETMVLPLVAQSMGVPLAAPGGILLYGPPGTGKTQIARAVASQIKGAVFFAVSPSQLFSKWQGQSEKFVRCLFDAARYYAPSVVFIDEVDGLTGARGHGGEGEGSLHVKVELLQQIDGVSAGGGDGTDPSKTLLILGATNRPWDLDEAFRRRFQKRIFISLPDLAMREALFRKFMSGKSTAADVSFPELAVSTEGFSCADIANVCKDAAYGPFREYTVQMHAEGVEVIHMKEWLLARGEAIGGVSMRHFTATLKHTRASTGDQTKLQQWQAEFGAE